MKRIGLFTPVKNKKPGGRSTTTVYVEVENAAELATKLDELGATRVGQLCRERTGTTRLEGEMFAPSAIAEKHLDWVTGKSAEFETRGLFYE